MNRRYVSLIVATLASLFFMAGAASGYPEMAEEKESKYGPFETPFTAPKAYHTVQKYPFETSRKELTREELLEMENVLLRHQLEEYKNMISRRDAEIEDRLKKEAVLKHQLDESRRALDREEARLERKVEKLAVLGEEKSPLFLKMEEFFAEDIAEDRIGVIEDKGELRLEARNISFFNSGSTDISEEGQNFLGRVSEVLKDVPDRNILIEGYTDSDQIKGILIDKYATNWELSTARATAAMRFLVKKGGLDPSRMSVAGYGEYRPISPEEKALNRRINIVLLPKEER